MIAASNILTVDFGTCTCTEKGGDEPFAHLVVLVDTIRNTDMDEEGRGPFESEAGEASDVARLLHQAETEMGEPANRRRLSTMAHLRAAVASATAGFWPVGHNHSVEEQKLDRYRDDLARAVGTARPDAGEGWLEGEGRHAPQGAEFPA